MNKSNKLIIKVEFEVEACDDECLDDRYIAELASTVNSVLNSECEAIAPVMYQAGTYTSCAVTQIDILRSYDTN